MAKKEFKKEMGLFMATALVISNMVGAGILMLPATLAGVAGPGATLIAWVLTGIGALILALTFANLGSKIPKNGGIYEYSRMAYGSFGGFMSAWLYWNGTWIGNASMFVVITTYLGAVFPILVDNHLISFLFSSAILWICTLINIRGTKFVGSITTALTVFKIILFGAFIIIAFMGFNSANLTPMFPQGKGIGTIPIAAGITLWAFMGLETASVTGGEIKNPERNIKLSTIFGMLISAGLYIVISFAAMGAMNQTQLANSTAPISDIISKVLKVGNLSFISVFIAISVFGTALGWLLSTARVSQAAGEDGVFPKAFSKIHPKYGTPHVSLIIGGVLVNIILVMNFTSGLSGAYSFIVLLATLSYLPVYAFTAIAEIILMAKGKRRASVKNYSLLVIRALIAFVFCIWGIISSGAITVMYGFILMMLGVPVYSYMRIKGGLKNENVLDEEF
ncbi:APC family permease [Clostridium mediterraneense]|uniref:APC family permease n=1 Tax=Clostridium mediterraneense TaxID=1805472 RepID=UPI0008325EA7|nr:amino acid permease [Clostridium mediterraneense]